MQCRQRYLTSLHVLTSKLELRRYLDSFSASPALAARRKLLLLSPFIETGTHAHVIITNYVKLLKTKC